MNEYKHILGCIKDWKKLPVNTTAWWEKFRWIRDRNRSSWMIGKITLDQYTKISNYLEGVEKKVKKEAAALSKEQH